MGHVKDLKKDLKHKFCSEKINFYLLKTLNAQFSTILASKLVP